MRIGNGATTSIWEDAWLRSERTGRIITTRPISSTFLDKVEDIIDWDIDCLNTSLIYQCLWPIDRDRIFQVPIGLVTTPDCLYWSHSKTGKFTLHSCYHMILDSKLRAKETKAGAFSGVTSIYWKWLWAICLPPKIRVLLWRACIDILPVGAELTRRKITSNLFCHFCRTHEETTVHLFFHCSTSARVWDCEPFSLGTFAVDESFSSRLMFLWEKLDTEVFELACVTIWKFWEI